MSIFLATLHDDLSYIVYLESCIRDKEHFIPRKRREMKAELKELKKHEQSNMVRHNFN